MKANKVAIVVSLLLNFGIGILLCGVDASTKVYDILMGVFTGLVVAFVSSIVGYFVERNKIKNKLQTIIPNTYFNMIIVKNITGGILPQIIYMEKLSELNYNNVIAVVELTLNGLGENELNTYSGFIKWGNLYNIVNEMKNFETKIYHLKNCLNDILINALKVDNLQLEKQIVSLGNLFPPEKEKLIFDTRNCVNIQTAKVHEYEASLINELEDLAIRFLGQKNWQQQKSNIHAKTNSIFNGTR